MQLVRGTRKYLGSQNPIPKNFEVGEARKFSEGVRTVVMMKARTNISGIRTVRGGQARLVSERACAKEEADGTHARSVDVLNILAGRTVGNAKSASAW